MLQAIIRYDLTVCLFFNRALRARAVHRLFALVSRLGDGVFWYVLMSLMPLMLGRPGLTATLHMAGVGIVGTLVYKAIKRGTARPRPCNVAEAIELGCDPLDLYSFPSGHTLHAVAFTIVAVYYLGALAWILIPFAALVAASRVILGLHYPTDVVCGAALGAGFALASLLIVGQ